MPRKTKTVMLVCATFLGFLGIASGASAQNGQAPSTAGQCRVSVDRSREAGVLDVVQQQMSDGSCVCVISTGPASQGQGVEGRVNAIQQSGRCSGARVAQVTGQAAAGGLSDNMVGLLGAAGIGSIIAVLEVSQDHNDLQVSP